MDIEGSQLDVESLFADVGNFLKLSETDLFGVEPPALAAIHLHHLRCRFEELRPKIKAVDRLAVDVGVERIDTLDDVVALCFPHTMYKSYSMTDMEAGRFDRLTRWLGTLTALDLGSVNIDGCDSVESWLRRIETQTQLRPLTSSGTTGKISIFPRSLKEEDTGYFEMAVRTFESYGTEPGIDIRSGEIPLLMPWPNFKGRHNLPVLFRVFIKHLYGGREDMVVTLSRDEVTADEMLLAGKLRRAEARGEELALSALEKQLARGMAERASRAADRWQAFVEEAVVKRRGQQVIFWGIWYHLYQIAKYCKDNGVRVEWAPNSIIATGGGTKGFVFPEGWRELIDEVMPFKYPERYREAYSFTESTANAILCSHNHLHPRPWGIPYVIDPDTSAPLPRSGVQKGRCCFFDLLPTTYWGGTITGDEVTMNWDGGCSCGRKGPYLLNNIRRYTETRDGDDKITCAKTPDAYEKLVEFSLSVAG